MNERTKERFPGMSLRRTIAAVTVFYALLLALNVAALHESIARQPFGPARTFWLSVTSPMANAARALRLDRPRAFVNETLGARINE